MEIYKIIAFAIIASILCFYLKSLNSELFIPALIATGIILLIFSIEYLTFTVSFFNQLFESSKVDKSIAILIIKLIALSYLIEFSASLVEDLGLKSIAEKLLFIGKILLFFMSLPMVELLTQTVFSFLE